jgi:hypothetical protein
MIPLTFLQGGVSKKPCLCCVTFSYADNRFAVVDAQIRQAFGNNHIVVIDGKFIGIDPSGKCKTLRSGKIDIAAV